MFLHPIAGLYVFLTCCLQNHGRLVSLYYESEIIKIVRGNGSPKVILNQLENYHGSDIADMMEQLNEQERKKIFRICPAEMLAEAFSHLEETQAGAYLNEIPLKKVTEILAELETDAAVGILHTVGKEKRALIIDALDEDIRKEIQLIASFDEDEIGSKMTTNCIILGVSLILAMLISSAVGTLIPLFFKKIKVDPAVASGPLITTVNDLVAVVTYYGMSWILLLNILKLV